MAAVVALAPTGRMRAVGAARVIVLVIHGANFERTFSIMLLNTVATAAIANGSVGPLNFAGAGLIATGRVGRARMCLLVCIPVVMGTHLGAVRVTARVVLDHVASEGITAGGGIAAYDAWDDGAAGVG